MTDDVLPRFVEAFTRAVAGEMAAMRQRLGPYEIPLAEGEAVDGSEDESRWLCRFRVVQPDDKIVQGGECSLSLDGDEALVTVVSLDGDRVLLAAPRPLEVKGRRATLVIYPWFLYERLQASLRSLAETPEAFHADTALALFGKHPAQRAGGEADADLPPTLNDSQRRAVALCRETTPAFVWGPPGTGKTTTLGHIVLSLLRQGLRVLVTSTTNAAVDQALACLAGLEAGRAAIERGEAVRLGQTGAQTYGAGLPEVAARLNAAARARLERVEARRARHLSRIEAARRALAALAADTTGQQLGLFAADARDTVDPRPFVELFGERHARAVLRLEPAPQRAILERRRERLERAARLGAERSSQLRGGLRRQERAVVSGAQLVLATMTNVYMSGLMEGERFDVVLVEEAGMAVLPTLFYCASLGRARSIMVGDPQQLPPIVQSDEPFVQRAMGRSIFAVTVPEPHASEQVVMLDTQYRMHPAIGDLVGGLFYDGRLRHGADPSVTAAIAAGEPYPGQPLVVVDTGGRATCETPSGSFSRFNEHHAELAVELAAQAVRAGAGPVAIIAPYVEQARRISRRLAREAGLAGRVECRTVHRFQGGERDVVIFDTVDAEPLPPGRLLSDKRPGSSAANLVNVSLSRARGKLLVLADAAYFRRRDPGGLVDRVLAAAGQAGTVVEA